jgi:hypothetical protein
VFSLSVYCPEIRVHGLGFCKNHITASYLGCPPPPPPPSLYGKRTNGEFGSDKRLWNIYLMAEKIYARLSNAPKYAFKSDILWFFEGCNLTPDQLVTIYDEKYRQRFL